MTDKLCLICGHSMTPSEVHDPNSAGVCDECSAELLYAGAAKVRTQRASYLLSEEPF